MDTPVQLIVGLGNPGPQYDRTRHNAGADFVLALANHYGVTLKADNKYSGLTGKAVINGKPVWLLIPTTFMNRSGKSIAALAGFYQIRSNWAAGMADTTALKTRFFLWGTSVTLHVCASASATPVTPARWSTLCCGGHRHQNNN